MTNDETINQDLPLISWEINNFKSVQSSSIEFSPLTLLVGGNSSGKSTLIQSLLLMAQNVDSQSAEINLNGLLFSGGSFASLLSRSNLSKSETVSFSGEISTKTGNQFKGKKSSNRKPTFKKAAFGVDLANLDPSHPASAATARSFIEIKGKRVELTIEAQDKDQYLPNSGSNARGICPSIIEVEGNQFQIIGKIIELDYSPRKTGQFMENLDLMPKIVEISSGFPSLGIVDGMITGLGAFFEWLNQALEEFSSKSGNDSYDYDAETNDPDRYLEVLSILARVILTELRTRRFANIDRSLKPTSKEMEARYREQFNDAKERFRVLKKNQYHRYIGRDMLTDEQKDVVNAVIDESNLLQKLLVDALKVHPISDSYKSVHLKQEWLLKDVSEEFDAVPQFFRSRLKYLGPLRVDPKHAYSYEGTVSTLNVPLGVKGENVYFELSKNPTVSCPLPDAVDVSAPVSLQKATNRWLEFILDSSEQVGISPPDEHGVGATYSGFALPNVGVGVSQILPIVVQAILMTPGEVLLLEQPELHLHPAPQQRLAEFFLTLVKTGRQLIVETHSEYLVTRLRRCAIETPEVVEKFKIIFAEKDANHGTRYIPIFVDDFGALSTWPDGFFDQASSDLEIMYDLVARKNS